MAMQQAMMPRLSLNPSLRYDAFIFPVTADDEDNCVARNGIVGYMDLYPEGAGMCADGTFDPEAWEDQKHPEIVTFTPNREGYRRAIVITKRQCAPITVIDLSDGYGFLEWEERTWQRLQKNNSVS